MTLTGDLTLHGVTKTVDIPAQAQIHGGQIQIQGSTNFPLSDYGMVAPNIGGFILSIADQGALEFLVCSTRANTRSMVCGPRDPDPPARRVDQPGRPVSSRCLATNAAAWARRSRLSFERIELT